MQEEKSKQVSKSKFDEIWENPVGKVVVITVATIAAVGIIGCSLKTLAFATNSFRDAARR
jgi:putative exporter of polyketide antibiotics